MTHIATRIAAVAVTAALLSTGAVAAQAAPLETPTTFQSDCTFAQHLVAIYAAVPADLRADLAEARSLEPGAERGAAMRAIKQAALAGEYGSVTQARVEAFGVYRAANPGRVNPELKADLKNLRATVGAAAKLDLAEDIAEKAIDGEYGESVRGAAERIQQSEAWQSCDA